MKKGKSVIKDKIVSAECIKNSANECSHQWNTWGLRFPEVWRCVKEELGLDCLTLKMKPLRFLRNVGGNLPNDTRSHTGGVIGSNLYIAVRLNTFIKSNICMLHVSVVLDYLEALKYIIRNSFKWTCGKYILQFVWSHKFLNFYNIGLLCLSFIP
jgi:hypothetical protein